MSKRVNEKTIFGYGREMLKNAPDSEGLCPLLLLFQATLWERRSFYTLLFSVDTPDTAGA